MYISSINLNGFKSFGKKTVLTFGEGITAVVGPNGCGKTNIVDAIRWVLGEQKQSVLRSTRMEEIIFNGSKSRKPSGMSEVALTIHNDKAKLPVEYTDIEITRRLYRDGESEYLINRNPVRRKDIIDLFIDTGMGSDAYSVIELKMIEDILAEAGDDRRRMFEEAAGINKYKKQRLATQRKLEATRLDLERVSDIILEVDGQVKSLGRQLKRFERHGKLSSELQEKELLLARVQLQQLDHEINPLRKALRSGQASHQEEAEVINRDEAQLTLFQETFDQQEQELGALRRSLEEGTTRLTELKQQEIQMGEQLRSTRDTATRLEREIEAEHSRLENLQQDLDKHTSDLETMIPGLEAGRQQYETKRSEESAVNRAYQSAEQKWHSARDRKNAHEHLVREEQSRLERAQEIITEKRQALDTLNESIKRRKESLKEQEQLKVKLTSKKTELESKLSSLGSQLDDNQSALDAVESEADAVKLQYREHQTELQVLQARAQIISELIQDGEGYPSGTQAILAQKSKFRGLLGTVADLVAVPAEQAEAIETVLGPLAACLVVEKRTQAEAIIQFASENGLGRASIIPLDRLNTSAASEPSPVNFGDAAPLVDFIKAPEQLRPLYNQLLMGFWWSAAAPEGGDQVPPGATLVTGEGHLFGLVEVLTHTGGGDRQEPVTLVGRSAELERLQTRMTELQGFVDESAGMIERLDSQIVALRDTAKSLNTDLDAAIAETNQQKNDLTRVAYEIDREQEDLSDLGKQVPELLTTISSFEASIEAQDKLINDLTAQGPKLDQGISQAQDNFTIAQQGQDAWREELQEIRLRLLGLENSRDNLAQRRLSLKESMEEAHQRLTRLRGEKELASVSISKLESNLAETGGQIKELQGKVHQQQKISAEQEARTRSTRDEISRLEAKIRQQQRGREAALAHQQSLELNIVELEKRAELIKARIQELYAVELDSTQAPDEDLDADELRQSIAQIRGSLERIGPINMAVSEEYDEETKRFNFLDEQRSDLLEAEDSLLETIGKIDHQARAQFRETYDSIRHHFQQTFNLFFEGGEGDLRLMGDPDPLEAAIEIIARPPGKKTKSLRSLSAGEKALTAIALLFAIYLVKPSPFCILDEVDAPLDDINIGKFSKAISQFSSETQFIIVTHNKLTMEQANFLYGVTMEEEGLSRLISVSLEQNAA